MNRDRIITSAISEAIAQTPSAIPAIPEIAGMLQTDLYNGPLYIDPKGEVCEFAEPGAKPFDFAAGIDAMQDWKSEIPTLYVDAECETLSETNPFDDPGNYEEIGNGKALYIGPETVYEVAPSEIVANLLGSLAEYI